MLFRSKRLYTYSGVRSIERTLKLIQGTTLSSRMHRRSRIFEFSSNSNTALEGQLTCKQKWKRISAVEEAKMKEMVYQLQTVNYV